MLKFQCPEMVLNLIKYIAFGLCILYVLDSNKSMEYYLQKGGMIGIGMVLVEYLIKNICRDMRENFTSGPDGVEGEEGEEIKELMTPIDTSSSETPTVTTMPPKDDEEDLDLDKMIDESIEDMKIEKDIMEEETQEQEEKQKIEYGYSFVHPSAMKLPEIRIPKCIQDNPCNVCPVMMGGTADLMQVKPSKKPKECDNEY